MSGLVFQIFWTKGKLMFEWKLVLGREAERAALANLEPEYLPI